MGSKSITFIVCPNGLGHFKRTLSIVNEILLLSSLNVNIVASPWHIKRRNFWKFPNIEKFHPSRVNFIVMDMPADLGWHVSIEDYNFTRYKRWLKTLENQNFMNSDVIISDNLVSPVSVRDDTLLVGSFLWPNILAKRLANKPNNPSDLEKITSFEENLLLKHRPEIICLKDMLMPYLKNHCVVHEVGWYCKKRSPVKEAKEPYKILYSIGGSGIDVDAFSKILKQIPKDVSIYVDEALSLHNGSFKKFSFNDNDFKELDLLVCRPGIGSLTNAIEHGIPVLALYDDTNPEMIHNVNIVENRKIGIGINVNDWKNIPELIYYMMNNKTDFINQSFQIHGAHQSASVILKRLT